MIALVASIFVINSHRKQRRNELNSSEFNLSHKYRAQDYVKKVLQRNINSQKNSFANECIIEFAAKGELSLNEDEHKLLSREMLHPEQFINQHLEISQYYLQERQDLLKYILKNAGSDK